MNKDYKQFLMHFESDWSIEDKCLFIYEQFGDKNLKDHVCRVAEKASSIAAECNLDPILMRHAAYLHDISCIIDKKEYKRIAQIESIHVLEEEEKFPSLLHQKLSRDIAWKIFGVESQQVLNAIECHTTLKRNASKFDMVLFISDKLEWEKENKPTILEEIETAVKKELRDGIRKYINYRMNNKEELLIVHPWLSDAYFDLNEMKECRPTLST